MCRPGRASNRPGPAASSMRFLPPEARTRVGPATHLRHHPAARTACLQNATIVCLKSHIGSVMRRFALRRPRRREGPGRPDVSGDARRRGPHVGAGFPRDIAGGAIPPGRSRPRLPGRGRGGFHPFRSDSMAQASILRHPGSDRTATPPSAHPRRMRSTIRGSPSIPCTDSLRSARPRLPPRRRRFASSSLIRPATGVSRTIHRFAHCAPDSIQVNANVPGIPTGAGARWVAGMSPQGRRMSRDSSELRAGPSAVGRRVVGTTSSPNFFGSSGWSVRRVSMGPSES
ncbi:hypothetical protein OJF2_42620 [Aquisphaera giovannonii]|uniref:Uncharacterized protein n=1 Tax=Aquisphaera giovannonii TaxID=406548 RepID=A0A5B9W6E8_9BACT|nr:hypothetical protein OJF2_42620 [Aquisphaera giovannonii]